MSNARRDHARHAVGRLAQDQSVSESVDLRHPDDGFLIREIEHDRRGERVLLVKALIAGLIVATLVVLRQLFFV